MTEVNKASPIRGPLGKTKEYDEVVKQAHADVARVYQRLFSTRDGKQVLADLMRRFYDNEISDSDTIRDIGKRDVLLYIKRRVAQ